MLTPEQVHAHYGMRPSKVIPLGTTTVTKAAFERRLAEISSRFTVDTYDLLKHNCNNFSDEAVRILTGAGIPREILDVRATRSGRRWQRRRLRTNAAHRVR